MKFIISKVVAAALLSGLLPFLTQQAQATSFFGGDGSISYSIQKVTNLDTEGSTTGLEISNEYSVGPVYTSYTGDGYSNVNGNADETDSLFSMGVDGGAPVNGFAEVSYTSTENMFFINNESNDRFAIEVLLEYSIMAYVDGDAAEATVFLDYYNRSGDFMNSTDVYASTISGVTEDTKVGSETYTFTLEAGDEEGIFASIGVDGLAEATGKPDPKPDPKPVPKSIPTMSQWALIMMSILLSLVVFSRERHQA